MYFIIGMVIISLVTIVSLAASFIFYYLFKTNINKQKNLQQNKEKQESINKEIENIDEFKFPQVQLK